MARFSGKIQSAKFVDIGEKTIEVLYGDDDSSILSSWYLQVDYNNQDFLDFVDEYPLEDVANNTKDFYDGAEENYLSEIQATAQDIAQVKFEQWVKAAQADLDAQDKERYELFEEYKLSQIEILEKEVMERAKALAVEKGQAKLDEQDARRYAIFEKYKDGQMEILTKEVEAYALEKQRLIENELLERQEEIEKSALEIEQELKFAQIQRDKAEVIKNKAKAQLQTDLRDNANTTKQKSENIDRQKADLLTKFRKNMLVKESSGSVDLDGQAFVNTILEKNEDEDFIFKSKISLFNREEIKKHPDRELKKKIKQAKDIISLIAAYKEVTETINEENNI